MPVTSSPAASRNSGSNSRSMCDLSQRSSRACTPSRGAPVRCSSATMRTRGLSASSPATSLPTGWPSQRMVPSVASTNCPSAACARRVARASISPASAFCAAPASAFASEPAVEASGVNMKPSSRPMAWPSTTTSPVLPMSVSSTVFSRSRRISTLVRRSTKRSVNRSCNASDSLSSTARATPCQCSGSASQSGRLAAKVQVRMWAMRFDSVSMSPSDASASLDLAGEPVGRDRTLPHQETI